MMHRLFAALAAVLLVATPVSPHDVSRVASNPQGQTCNPVTAKVLVLKSNGIVYVCDPGTNTYASASDVAGGGGSVTGGGSSVDDAIARHDGTSGGKLNSSPSNAPRLADTGEIWTKKEIVDVMHPDFGVKCDGSTDDTTALQAVFDHADPGAQIKFPYNSTCMISNTGIDCDGCQDLDIDLNGSTVRVLATAADTDTCGTTQTSMLMLTDAARITVRNGILDGNLANRTANGGDCANNCVGGTENGNNCSNDDGVACIAGGGTCAQCSGNESCEHCILIWDSEDITIRDMTIQECMTDGVSVTRNDGSPVENTRIRVTGNTVKDTRRAGIGFTNYDQVWIEDNRLITIGKSLVKATLNCVPISMETGNLTGSKDGATIRGNYISGGFGDDHIRVTGLDDQHNVVVTGNTSVNAWLRAINFSVGTSPGGPNLGNVAAGNVIRTPGVSGEADSFGITWNDRAVDIVSGNTVDSPDQGCFRGSNWDGTILVGNHCLDPAGARGIHLGASGSGFKRATLLSNTVINRTGSGTTYCADGFNNSTSGNDADLYADGNVCKDEGAPTAMYGVRVQLNNSGADRPTLRASGNVFFDTQTELTTSPTTSIWEHQFFSPVRDVTINHENAATAGDTLVSSRKLTMRGSYWDGADPQDFDSFIWTNPTSTAPAGQMEFYVNGSRRADLDASGQLDVTGNIITSGGDIVTNDASNPAIQANEGGTSNQYIELRDVSTGTGDIQKRNGSGLAELRLFPNPSATGAAELSLLEGTVTSGVSKVSIYDATADPGTEVVRFEVADTDTSTPGDSYFNTGGDYCIGATSCGGSVTIVQGASAGYTLDTGYDDFLLDGNDTVGMSIHVSSTNEVGILEIRQGSDAVDYQSQYISGTGYQAYAGKATGSDKFLWRTGVNGINEMEFASSGDLDVAGTIRAGSTVTASTGVNIGSIEIVTGSGVPNSAECDADAEIGDIYIRTDNTGADGPNLYVCEDDGAGGYAWEGK